MSCPTRFIKANTALLAPPLVPEVRLHLATEIVPLWRSTEEELVAQGVPPPYWAFAWAGGQALARYLLDNPQSVSDKAILDFGSGSGLVAVAAAKSGARSVLAADIDIFSAAAISLNAAVNDVEVSVCTDDLIGCRPVWQTILVGDMCYERPLAERILLWLRECLTSGVDILLGDPGRSYFPRVGVEGLATSRVQTSR